MGNHALSGITSKTEKEIISDVKLILNSMSKSKFAYDEAMNTINFDLAVAGFSSEEKEKLSQTLISFSNSKDEKIDVLISDNLALFLDFFYRTIVDIKKVAKHGNVFHDIIVRYYIEKEFANIDDAVESIDGVRSRATFIRRANEACYQLYIIWYCTSPKYISCILSELMSL